MPYLLNFGPDYEHDIFVSYAHGAVITDWSRQLADDLRWSTPSVTAASSSCLERLRSGRRAIHRASRRPRRLRPASPAVAAEYRSPSAAARRQRVPHSDAHLPGARFLNQVRVGGPARRASPAWCLGGGQRAAVAQIAGGWAFGLGGESVYTVILS